MRARIPATTAAEREAATPSSAQPAPTPAVPEERDAAAAHLEGEAP